MSEISWMRGIEEPRGMTGAHTGSQVQNSCVYGRALSTEVFQRLILRALTLISFCSALSLLVLSQPDNLLAQVHHRRTTTLTHAPSFKTSTRVEGVGKARASLSAGAAHPSAVIGIFAKNPLGLAPLRMTLDGPKLTTLPIFSSMMAGAFTGRSASGDVVRYSVLPQLQIFVEKLLKDVRSNHAAIVALDPRTGRVLALAGKSRTILSPLFHQDIPAASVFKVITSTAAIETAGLQPATQIRFSGATTNLTQWNYEPNIKRDRRSMSIMEALGRSVNPVFSRVALKFLTPPVLRDYTNRFGFNRDFDSDFPLPISRASIPADRFGFGRTAAGFGEVQLSPVHAAVLMSVIANGGKLIRPYLVDSIFNKAGKLTYRAHVDELARVMKPSTSRTLLQMMTATTTTGTSRDSFAGYRGKGKFPYSVAAKTGTLRGTNPEGINHWFVAAAPSENPRIAIAILAVDPVGRASRPARIGRRLLDQALVSPMASQLR